MTKTILTFFTNSGAPATGLSATIRIRDLSTNSLVITNAAMTEVGDGFYKYDFTTYDEDADYSIRADGSSSLTDSERYTYAGNESYVEDIWDAQIADHQVVGRMASEIRASHGSALGGNIKNRLTLQEAQTLAELVWKVILDGKREAKEVLLTRSDFEVLTDRVLLKEKIKFPEIDFPEVQKVDLGPVVTSLQRLEGKVDKLPVEHELTVALPDIIPVDLSEIKSQLLELRSLAPQLDRLEEALQVLGNTEIDWSRVEEVKSLITGQELLTEERVAGLLAEMTTKQNHELRETLRMILLSIKNVKYDILRR